MNFVEQGFVDNGYFVRDSDTQGNFRFDGLGKLIFVNDGVTSISIADMYARACDWLTQDDNLKFKMPLRFSGYDPIPGGFTGVTFFCTNGWRVVYDANQVGVQGVLYSDDYQTAYWSQDLDPIYPATVASLVNHSVSYQNVVTGDLGSLNIPTAAQVRDAVWAKSLEGLTAEEMMRIMLAAFAGKTAGIGTNNEQYLAQDGTTPRISATFDAQGNRTGITLNGA